uniref:Uncharacterized protein n=1 Tax=Octopus bimaculoides TaxID=37653 RepID=A0A0L8HN01_OCTBM
MATVRILIDQNTKNTSYHARFYCELHNDKAHHVVSSIQWRTMKNYAAFITARNGNQISQDRQYWHRCKTVNNLVLNIRKYGVDGHKC